MRAIARQVRPASRAISGWRPLDVAHLLVRAAESALPEGMLSSFDIVSVLGGRDPRLTRMIRPGPARPLVSAIRLSDTTVGQVMHPRVITCLPDTPLHELAGRMAALHVHCTAVSGVGRCLDGDEHIVWALVSDMDVIHAARRGRLATPAGDLATTTPIALPEDATLERAATLMASHDAAHVVAVGPRACPQAWSRHSTRSGSCLPAEALSSRTRPRTRGRA